VSAHIGNSEEGGSHPCTLVGDLGYFLPGRPEALFVFLELCEVSKPRLTCENLRFDRRVQLLIPEYKFLGLTISGLSIEDLSVLPLRT
jgi:hypothetical protein